MYRRPRGFTLIEILVALVVLAIMSVAAYGGLHELMNSRATTRDNQKHFHKLQIAMVTLTRDLEQSVSRPIRHASGEFDPAMLGGDKDVPELAFTRAGHPNPLRKPRSSLQRVAYTVDHGKLVRLFYTVLDRTVEETPKRQVLLPGVKSLKLRFLDQFGKWNSHWPPINSEPHQFDRHDPVAVEVTLDTKRWGTIKRLVEVAP